MRLFMVGFALGAAALPGWADDAFELFRERTKQALEELEKLHRGRRADLDRLVRVRKGCRSRWNEQDAHTALRARQTWKKTKGLRTLLKKQCAELVAPWRAALAHLPKASAQAEQRKEIADHVFSVVDRCARIVGPTTVARQLLDTERVRRALAWHQDDSARRGLLSRVADWEAAAPGETDLATLLAVLRWSAAFHGDETPGKSQLNAVTADLILVFTERSPNGITVSNAGFYRERGLRDAGFQESLRDGSDQVRHFCWAFRMFAVSSDSDLTARLLRLKEERDARTRKEELNRADLRLNATARTLVARIRGPETAKPQPLSTWASLVAQTLGAK